MNSSPRKNTLYYGDNLEVLRRYVKDESVDLVYLDPPFNSNQAYNVLFAEQNGTRSSAQIRAFEDTWVWGNETASSYEEVVEAGGPVADVMRAFRTFLGTNNLMAYLGMMAPRLVELRRVLKKTGSIYLHCDSTASHYLKILLDAIFEPSNFRNEIIWQRFGSHNDPKRFGRVTDTILFYTVTDTYTFNPVRTEYSEDHINRRFRYRDPDGRRFWPNTMLAPGGRGPSYEWNGHTRNWRFTKEKMQELEQRGEVYYSASGMAYRKNYLDELKGQLVQSLWTDIRMTKSGAERLGYPTQKPEALLERIISASSETGDLVLDPFCGCGTAVAVAQKLRRSWIGIDITHLAVTLIKHRLSDTFGDSVRFDVIGEPAGLPDAATLAAADPFQFQWWALGLVGARPVEGKRGADRGVDGRLYFHDEPRGGKSKQIVFSIKAGRVTVPQLRDLHGVLHREDAQIGVFISLDEPTKAMRKEAAGAGFYTSPFGSRHPRLQLLTIEELLQGRTISYPPARQVDRTFKRAPAAREKTPPARRLPLDETSEDPESQPKRRRRRKG